MSNILPAQEHVLSTLEGDGSRRWLKPKLSKGKLLERRRWMAYILIGVFTLIPFVKIGGTPLVLLDITARRFTILTYTFLPTDTVLLAIFMVGLLLSIFLFTALFGRVWCGWACPQTVYMEFLFRPVERFFDGTVGRGGPKKDVPAWKTAAKYLVYFILCVYLANTFLAYFIGVDRLKIWVTQSPLQHPVPFLVMAFVTFAMMVDFCYFREQMCLIACPYGRFQSVMLDRNSMIVAYDQKRGEPRGKKSKSLSQKGSDPLEARQEISTFPPLAGEGLTPFGMGSKASNGELPVIGDCIDCGNCVTTCPTGIDIRQGLQMECINCTQCIDACNLVMEKVGRPKDLIRYSSQARDAGERGSLLRARTLIYPTLLTGIVTAFVTVFLMSKSFDAVVLREAGNPYVMTDDGKVRNLIKLKLTNRTDDNMTFTTKILEPSETVIEVRQNEIKIPPRETVVFHASIISPKTIFLKGQTIALIEIENQHEVSRTIRFKILGPF